MHGIVHAELKRFIETKHGRDAWSKIAQQTGLGNKIYMPTGTYPDQEVLAIVKAASELTRTPAAAILEDFGEFIVPTLMNMYKTLIKPEWGTMELLLNTEETIHRVVRIKNPGAQPPLLKFEKTGPNTLKFHYDSARQMSAVAKGIMKGVAAHYRNTLSIQEKKNADGSIDMSIKVQ